MQVDITKEIAAAQKALVPAVRKLKKLLELKPKDMPVGKVADTLYVLRELKSVIGKLTNPLTEDILGPVVKNLEDHFIMTLAVGEASGVQGAYSRVQVTPYAVPILDGEDKQALQKFVAYVVKTKQYDLLKRDVINRDAVRERWDAKKQVVGVTAFNTKKVSCTKLSGKKSVK